MKFDIRSLFYAVRELFLKRWPESKFYEYNSFTQDFTRKYEREHGKIPGMVRGPRGMYASCSEYGSRTEEVVRPGLYLARGVGNKIVVVEKMGLFDQMVQNNFDKRLDCIIMTTQGFTTEAGRDALVEVEQWGLPICILHDYDTNGVLIKETLTKPTKRLDTELDGEKLVDVGLNFEVVNQLMESRGLTPEPVNLANVDISKLEGMLQRGEISQEERDFLLKGRVELNALTPLELLEWLESRLEELNLWKTVPKQGELDEHMKRRMISDLEDTKRDLVGELTANVEQELGIKKIWDALYEIRRRVEERLDAEISERMEDLEYPTKPVGEFKDELRENMEKYWKALAEEIAGELAEGLSEPVKEKVQDEQSDIVSAGKKDENVIEAKGALASEARTWLDGQTGIP